MVTATHDLNGDSSLKYKNKTQLMLAIDDIRDTFSGNHLWFYLAWLELKQRYRRSVLGPIWITVSTAIMLGAMGPLYGRLLNQPLSTYFQHLSVSFVVWNMLSSYLNEVCSAFSGSEGFIKQIRLTYFTYVMKVLMRNLISLSHNLLVVAAVLFFFPPENPKLMPLFILSLLVLVANMIWIGTVLALICARFRDVPQIVSSVILVLFFITPIMWSVDMLGKNRAVATYNLLYHWIELVRAPLLGRMPDNLSIVASIVSAVVGSIFAVFVFARFRSRISYWI